MEKLVTNMDQHGRMLIPAEIRRMLNLQPGDKVNLEIYDNEVKIINSNKIIDEMHAIFTKNQNDKYGALVDDYIDNETQEQIIEEGKENHGQ